jgi:hypothetical protein
LAELGFPKPQNVRRDRTQPGDISDAEIQLIRNFRLFLRAMLRQVSGHAGRQALAFAHPPLLSSIGQLASLTELLFNIPVDFSSKYT